MTTQILETWKESEKSSVYLAYDETHRRMVVEKHLRTTSTTYETLQPLIHPYLPQIYQVERRGDTLVIIEEYIQGGSIADISVSEKELEKWFRELCQVLRFLHGHGIIHRDIKPSNLLLGEDGHIRLIDFDAARAPQPSAQQDTVLLGTQGYAPPEQYGFAQTDQRADIYALGVTFEGLLGQSAHKRKWKRLLRKCKELDPKRRFSSILHIQISLLLGQLRHWVVYPLVALFLLYYVGGLAALYFFSADAKPYVQVILDSTFASERDQVFAYVDMDELSPYPSELCQKSSGEVSAVAIETEDGTLLLYTGYETTEGETLYGEFKYNAYGDGEAFSMFAFQGLCYYDADAILYRIEPQDCSPYGVAVWALYELNIFD